MSNSIVVNKLNLGNDTVGYRIDILDTYSKKIISVDISDKKVKQFLKMVGSAKISKGVIIKGKVVNGLFVTGDDDKVLEVKTKAQAEEVLNKYFFNSDSYVENVLDGITSTKEDMIKNSIEGHVDTLKGTEFGKYRKVKEDYDYLIKALKGLKYNLYVEEYQDSVGGELIISSDVSSKREVLGVFYRFEKYQGAVSKDIQVSVKGGGYKVIHVNFNESLEKFLENVEKNCTGDEFEVVDENTRCSFSNVDFYVFSHSIGIPGYKEVEYTEDMESLLSDYSLL